MAKQTHTRGTRIANGTDWVSFDSLPKTTDSAKIRPDRSFVAIGGIAYATEPEYSSTDDSIAFASDVYVLTDSESTIPISVGRKSLPATVLETDDTSVVCEIIDGDESRMISLPIDLVPANFVFGTPIWLSLDNSSGARRFVISTRNADKSDLAAGIDELDEAIANFEFDE